MWDPVNAIATIDGHIWLIENAERVTFLESIWDRYVLPGGWNSLCLVVGESWILCIS